MITWGLVVWGFSSFCVFWGVCVCFWGFVLLLFIKTLKGIFIAAVVLSIELNDPIESIALSSKWTSLLNLYFLLKLYEVSWHWRSLNTVLYLTWLHHIPSFAWSTGLQVVFVAVTLVLVFQCWGLTAWGTSRAWTMAKQPRWLLFWHGKLCRHS